ncbi:MAG: SDR family NAD(P)-dependent oxidoreductase [Pseudomonadota bacterium]
MSVNQAFEHSNRPDCLKGLTILVTGAGSDFGHAVSTALARHGAGLLLLDSKQRYLSPVYDDVAAIAEVEPVMIPFDLAAPPEHFHNIAQVIRHNVTCLDGLIHLASMNAPLTPMSHNKLDQWSVVFDKVTVAPLRLTQELLPCLQESAHASVLFQSIDVARQPRAFWGPLGAAYAALENAVTTFQDELENSSIRFNTIDPGRVKSAMRKKNYPAEPSTHLRKLDDSALLSYFIFLMSPASIDVHGQQITVPNL